MATRDDSTPSAVVESASPPAPPESDATESEPQVLPLDVPRVTVNIFASTIANKDIAFAFKHCEKLQPRIRRMTMDAWQKVFDEWRAQPR